MPRWKLTIEYKGTDFYGWQWQDDVPTVQRAITEAIKAFCQQDVTLHVAGRTDAGVHAKAQVAHADFETSRPMSNHEVAKAINAHLRPRHVSVIKAEVVDENFHARFGAKNKLYHYRIIGRSAFLAIDHGLAWHAKKKLNAAAMHEAAQILTGHHDFTTFRDTDCQAKSPVKTLDRLDVREREYDAGGGTEIVIEAEAKSFLHHQVRNMVGALSLVGEGRWTKDGLRAALEARDRTKGGPTAPPDGLYLIRVDY